MSDREDNFMLRIGGVWRIGWRSFVASAVIALLVSSVAVAEDAVMTPGGLLVIRQLDEGFLGSDFAVMLGKREVIRSKEGDEQTPFSNFPVPHLLKYVDKAIPPFEAVAVFQQFSWGNACNGGPIWFLGIHKDGTFTVSDPIDFCGGLSPKVTVTSEAVHVISPASDGKNESEPSPEKEWIFFQGKVKALAHKVQ
jgi:hypothetical protein